MAKVLSAGVVPAPPHAERLARARAARLQELGFPERRASSRARSRSTPRSAKRPKRPDSPSFDFPCGETTARRCPTPTARSRATTSPRRPRKTCSLADLARARPARAPRMALGQLRRSRRPAAAAPRGRARLGARQSGRIGRHQSGAVEMSRSAERRIRGPLRPEARSAERSGDRTGRRKPPKGALRPKRSGGALVPFSKSSSAACCPSRRCSDSASRVWSPSLS